MNYPKTISRNQILISELARLPSTWVLTPVKDKAPKRYQWQSETPLTIDELTEQLSKGYQAKNRKTEETYTIQWNGYGLRTGSVSGGLIALDVDGSSAQPILEAMSQGDLPLTVSWTSNRVGRYQLLYQLPLDIQSQLTDFTKKDVKEFQGIKTSVGEDGEFEQLEFRYNGVQSVLPPSKHPKTGSYEWINSPDSTPVADAPKWLCDKLLGFVAEKPSKTANKTIAANTLEFSTRVSQVGSRPEDSEVIEALNCIDPDEDYDEYYKILMALHSHNPDLLPYAIDWADRAKLDENQYRTEADVTKHWESFTPNDGISVSTLFYHAKKAGWKGSKSYDDFRPITPLEAATKGLPLPLELVTRKNKPPTHKLPSEAATARYIAVSMKSELGFHSDEKQFYGYEKGGGYWELKDEHQLKRIVGKVIKNTDKGDAHDLMHSTFIRGVLYHLPIDAENTPKAVDKNVVPFLGAWFDVESKQWVEPTNEHFVTSPLPIKPIEGDYSRIENWLKSAVKGDEKTYDLLRCLFWLVLTGDTSRQVYYEIVGLGGTGKGTLCELLKMMVGEKYSRSVSFSTLDRSVSFSTLEKSQFQTATLHQKRVVILPDQNKYSGSCEILRQYTGGDDLPLEIKGNATLGNFKAAGIMIVTANDFLRFSDGTEALDRRRIPIKFDVKATEEDKAKYPDFKGYLAEALPHWVTHILNLDRDWIYQTLAKRRDFTLEARVEQMLEANNVAQWLDSCVAVAEGQKSSVGTSEMNGSLYCSYVDFCKSGNFNPVNIKNFRKEVETLLYTSLGWKESEVHFKKTNQGQTAFGLILNDGRIEIGQNPITRAEIKREPIDEEKF